LLPLATAQGTIYNSSKSKPPVMREAFTGGWVGLLFQICFKHQAAESRRLVNPNKSIQ
jgi:hypothetical protein